MKILIAGGGGYIGCRLVPKLINRGYKVSVVDLFIFDNHLPKEVSILNKDIFHINEEDLSGYDQVIFMAGLSNDPMAEYSPSENFIFNAAAPAYLGYISKLAKVKRYIYASSCSVYGYTEEDLYKEDAPTTVQYPYGVSKLQGEHAVRHFQDENFSVIILRQGTVCGYSPRMRLDLVINTMFKFAVSESIIKVTNPAIWRPILGIEDATNAYIRAIEANEIISGTFNVASGNYTLGAISDIVRYKVEELFNKKVAIDIHNIKDIRNYKVDINKSKNILSFIPADTVDSIVEDLHKHIDQFRDFDNPKYYNIEVFKKWTKRLS